MPSLKQYLLFVFKLYWVNLEVQSLLVLFRFQVPSRLVVVDYVKGVESMCGFSMEYESGSNNRGNILLRKSSVGDTNSDKLY